jgi:hypothetical protein
MPAELRGVSDMEKKSPETTASARDSSRKV